MDFYINIYRFCYITLMAVTVVKDTLCVFPQYPGCKELVGGWVPPALSLVSIAHL
jgi:hypothetical protein